ncbi:sensor histidine kinase [Lapidilactobacillus bayanensis]|uniref:sensor histidine kinase n=1 Tax=Lapidilactobacillus bayanensis TaxID=2485998 RepID=UPI0013DE548E|nr:HAMP domain-containing sensor histidine kinase [Lapidilactobacillus bayanensis]
MIWILVLLLMFSLTVSTLLILELRRLIIDLTYINTHETNAELTTQTSWPIFTRLVKAINHSLIQNRTLKEEHVRQQQQVHMMLTNLTHDIKTPLTVASGYVQLLQKSAPNDNHLSRIAHNLTAVNYYLRYLMDYNLIQEQTTRLHLESINLTQLIQVQLFDVFDELTERQLTLIPDLASDVQLNTDKEMVTRVIQNLIGNWLKYASGTLTVSLDEPDLKHVRVVFANQTNATIPDVSQLTDRFYTGDPARQDSTGLGLSIVNTLMTQLNGKMNLQAEDGWFRVTLQFLRINQE